MNVYDNMKCAINNLYLYAKRYAVVTEFTEFCHDNLEFYFEYFLNIYER